VLCEPQIQPEVERLECRSPGVSRDLGLSTRIRDRFRVVALDVARCDAAGSKDMGKRVIYGIRVRRQARCRRSPLSPGSVP